MRREIGSEFWCVPTGQRDNGVFCRSTSWYSSGRAALDDVISSSRFESVALPSWCCDSMIEPFLNAGKSVVFYPPMSDVGRLDTDALLVIDYFGYSDRQKAIDFPGIVIRDLTHSVFCKEYFDADYYFGSLRKWAGFWTGGFAFAKEGRKLSKGTTFVDENDQYVALRKQAMEQKARYVCGEIDQKDYLKTFAAAEELLEKGVAKGATERDVDLAKRLDVAGIKAQRRANASVLLAEFADVALFPELKEDDCPIFVPILVPNGKRDALRRWLIQQEIYCPVHWPLTALHSVDESAKFIYDNELSLVCDQRYNEDDMNRVVGAIKEFFAEEEIC